MFQTQKDKTRTTNEQISLTKGKDKKKDKRKPYGTLKDNSRPVQHSPLCLTPFIQGSHS